MNKKADLPEEDVIVKKSICNSCKNVVTVAILHMMDIDDQARFSHDAFKYNLTITEQPLLEYRKESPNFCTCDDSNN